MAPRRFRNSGRRSVNTQSPQSRSTQSQVAQIRAQSAIDSQDLIYADTNLSEARVLAIWRSKRAETEAAIRNEARILLARHPEPRPDDRDMLQAIRNSTGPLLDQLDLLLEERMRLAPVAHPYLESSLVKVRVKLDVIYWRIFRINDLPPEILANIFRLVAWSPTKQNLSVKYRLCLTSVCRHWRSVAISDSTIWNAIWFRHDPPYEQPLTWLNRAGTAPLDLRILDGDEEENPDGSVVGKFTNEAMGTLLDKIFVKLSQIRVFVVVLETWPPALVILDKLSKFGVPGLTMNLERFEIHRTGGDTFEWIGPGYTPDARQFPIRLFGNASSPRLKYLCLNGIHVDWATSPLSNLTTLDIRRIALQLSPNLTRFRHMLQSSPNLFKLSLDGAGPSVGPSPDLGLDPIYLPRLRVLVFGDFSVHYGLYVFAQIDTSSVRDLTLMNMSGEDYTPFVAAMISRFREVQILTMYTFEVDDSPWNREVFVKWLESMPNIRYLKFAQVKLHILETLVETRTQTNETGGASTSSAGPSYLPTNIRQVVCPRLHGIEYQNMPASVIIQLVQKRMDLGAPIRKVYVNGPWTKYVSEEEQAALRRITNLFIAPTGATSPEEAAIIREYSS